VISHSNLAVALIEPFPHQSPPGYLPNRLYRGHGHGLIFWQSSIDMILQVSLPSDGTRALAIRVALPLRVLDEQAIIFGPFTKRQSRISSVFRDAAQQST
jgi:hypothetical protein